MIRFLVAMLLCFLASVGCQAKVLQTTETKIFDSTFSSLKVSVDEDFMAVPVVRKGTDVRVIISFDQIANDVSYLRYRILHCNADWQVSSLLESEYVDGFNEVRIEDYAFSSNTFVHFVNYRIELPNSETQFLVSGNYLLQVFPEDNPDNTLLQARFCISEEAIGISGTVLAITDRGVNDTFQQLEISVDRLGFPVQNPISDFIVTVEQNNDPATRRVLSAPLRIDGDRLIFEHLQQLIFEAGNEFRRFETVSVPQIGLRIDSTRYIDGRYHSYVTPDIPRTRNYFYDRTQQGRFLVRQLNATDSDLGADYVDTHFTLMIPEQIGAEVFVEGEMTSALPEELCRMDYDSDLGGYTLTLPLKQGSYNYRYTLRSPGSKSKSAAPIEGNHYQTRNEYTVKVYYRAPGSRGDRLLGVRTITNF